MKKSLENQYLASFEMFETCVKECSEELWFKREGYSSPAWQIAYHSVYFANVYLSSSADQIVPWHGEVEELQHLSKDFSDDQSLTQSDISDFIAHVVNLLPEYLNSFSPDEPCWPHWYDLSQFEFQINNLRHIQHHTGQLTERLRSVSDVKLGWKRFGTIN